MYRETIINKLVSITTIIDIKKRFITSLVVVILKLKLYDPQIEKYKI